MAVTVCQNLSECQKTACRESNLEYFCLLDAVVYILIDVYGRLKAFSVLHYQGI
jgi:hypothetical protein